MTLCAMRLCCIESLRHTTLYYTTHNHSLQRYITLLHSAIHPRASFYMGTVFSPTLSLLLFDLGPSTLLLHTPTLSCLTLIYFS